MNIPINAKVYCQDRMCGKIQAVILNPVTDILTHVIVKERKIPHSQRLVPIDLIDASLSKTVHLKCDQTCLDTLPPFVETDYVRVQVPRYMQVFDMLYLETVVLPEVKNVASNHYHLPRNELVVRRGTSVYSSEGILVGNVDEFLVNPDDGQVTHLIMRAGHLLRQQEITIPVTALAKIKVSKIRLNLKKDQVGVLPAIPVTRTWI